MNYVTAGRIIKLLLILSVIVVTVSGIGIVEFRWLDSVSYGVLNKVLAHKVHLISWIPFLVFLVVHIIYTRAVKGRLNKNSPL